MGVLKLSVAKTFLLRHLGVCLFTLLLPSASWRSSVVYNSGHLRSILLERQIEVSGSNKVCCVMCKGKEGLKLRVPGLVFLGVGGAVLNGRALL